MDPMDQRLTPIFTQLLTEMALRHEPPTTPLICEIVPPLASPEDTQPDPIPEA